MLTKGVYFRVLGPLAVDVDGDRIGPPRSRVLQGLLGVLLLARGEPLPTARLARLVWADRAEAASRESVHVGVSRLRKWLRQLEGRDAVETAIHYDDGYLLVSPATSVDLHRFRDATGRARSLADPAARSRALESALELRRGPVLEGMSYLDRSDPLVRAAQRDVRQAVMDLAGAALLTGAPQGALAAARSLAEELQFDEPLHAALIDLLAAGGSPAEALQVYRRLSERLTGELGVEPGEKVQEAHLRVLSADHPLTARPDAAPAAPDVPVPAQLPPDIPDFAGRADEVGLLTGVLARRDGGGPATVAVATVAGMGGLGKTTLAVHVAHRLAGAFPGGQLYCDLRGDCASPVEPEEVLGRFLRAFGMSGSGIPASLEERTALYRSRLAGRRTLIILDNVAGEDQVRPLLPGTPDAAVLITSRNRLIGLEGATLLNLDILSPSQAVDMIGGIVGEARVAVERDNATEIAGLCGHVPLAVRIAAARLLSRPHWTLAHLVDLLRAEWRRLDELSVGDLEIRTGFELSYQRLPAAARRALRLAGLLQAPSFAAWAVAALLDASLDEAQSRLESLIDAHLVSVVGVDETGHLRYRMHDLVRLYALERAEAEDSGPERAAALDRALGAWLSLAERAADRVPGPCYAAMHGAAPRWRLPAASAAALLKDPMRWFAAERAALVAEVRQACDLRLDETAWDLAASMEKYCDVKGMYDDWRQMHEGALRLCRETGNARGEAVLLRGLLEVTTWTSPHRLGKAMDRLLRLSERLLALFDELGDPVGMADAMVAMVWALMARGEEDEALLVAERALRVSEQAGYLGGQARALHVMAAAHGERHPERAIVRLERALEVADRLGNARYSATVMQFLGAARALSGDVDSGRRLLEETVAMARDLDDRYLETFSLLYLAKLYAATGDARARCTAELALAHSRDGNFRHHLADALAVLGELNLAEGEVPAAVSCLESSVGVWRTRGWIPYLARTLRTLGDAYAAAADHEAAQAAWAEARELFERISDDAGGSSVEDRLTHADITA